MTHTLHRLSARSLFIVLIACLAMTSATACYPVRCPPTSPLVLADDTSREAKPPFQICWRWAFRWSSLAATRHDTPWPVLVAGAETGAERDGEIERADRYGR